MLGHMLPRLQWIARLIELVLLLPKEPLMQLTKAIWMVYLKLMVRPATVPNLQWQLAVIL